MNLQINSADPGFRTPQARLREASGYDWRTVRSFRSKEEAGHEEPWFAFLSGDDPGYPERILAAAQAQVRHRLARMERYRDLNVPEADIHVWQQSNPVVAEALVQLTRGGPQVIYNGVCSRRGCAITTRRAGAPVSRPRSPRWYPASIPGRRSSTWSIWTRTPPGR
jgi:hypothetical protein